MEEHVQESDSVAESIERELVNLYQIRNYPDLLDNAYARVEQFVNSTLDSNMVPSDGIDQVRKLLEESKWFFACRSFDVDMYSEKAADYLIATLMILRKAVILSDVYYDVSKPKIVDILREARDLVHDDPREASTAVYKARVRLEKSSGSSEDLIGRIAFLDAIGQALVRASKTATDTQEQLNKIEEALLEIITSL